MMAMTLTQEQHDRFLHWCGKYGAQLDDDLLKGRSECAACHRLAACRLDHSITIQASLD